MSTGAWAFAIDVGGTFTDVVARRPDGAILTHKLLSTGAVRGVVERGCADGVLIDSRRCVDPVDFWTGYDCTVLHCDGTAAAGGRVRAYNSADGALHLDPCGDLQAFTGHSYELRSAEEAPIVAMRYLMGLRLADPVGAIEVRLGTTRATNALLERRGAAVAFVTTRGFGDILKIGDQARPALFELHIRKRAELARLVIEIDERLNAKGAILRSPDPDRVREQLWKARADGAEALAICLLHAHVNPAHEEIVGRIAEEIGFAQTSISSRAARMEKIVSRGDTTVVDAYLGPVIRQYVAALRRSLPQARLRLMTSGGGLIDAEGVGGKETILSGPAGGVVGAAHVARVAGWGGVIGFDMGGTSTDVSRIEPPPAAFEYQHETVKTGVRIVAPMLAVETVAAGGGSLCAFDGQKLTVGPRSAGADPGPACYGRGGPLTITDMNLFLGRIVPEFFPFRLDAAAVESKLAGLMQEVADATKTALTAIELADGFVRIADAHMAAAIKRISTAKGYDAREYTLLCFGGAGGQHACAVARLLGIPRVALSPLSGVLSALGIAAADVKRIGERSVHRRLDADGAAELQGVGDAITNELRAAILAEGVEDDPSLRVSRSWDLCYAGQASLITVPVDDVGRAQAEFERRHRRLYGYAHVGRAIEIRVIRVELTMPSRSVEMVGGHAGASTGGAASTPLSEALTSRTTAMVVDGARRGVPVVLRRELRDGQSLDGPAIILEETSTVVVDAGWRAIVCANGDLLLTDLDPRPPREDAASAVDPIQLELFNNRFAAVAEQMGVTLQRTALSTNVKERLDFSCAVFTPQGELVVNAPHIPVHLGGMSDCVKALIEDVGRFAPGDVYITNDPYRGGSHLNDVTVITPVHDDLGREIEFFVASRAHHAEIGGTRPGSMPPDSTCLAEEGVLLRVFPWICNGSPQAEQLRALLTAPPYPSRAPQDNLADIAAQVAANQTGVGELKGMTLRHGVGTVHAYMRHIQIAAERKMRAALRKIPPGTYRFDDGLDDGSQIRLALTIAGDQATLDFAGTAGVLPGNLNANRSIVTSAVMYCLRCLIDEDIPLNAGVLAPISLVLPECFLNPRAAVDPRQCPAVVGGNVETSQRIVDCIFGALGTVAASQGTMNNLLFGDERFGYYETLCGGAGAGPGFDGADAVHTHMTNTRLTDPEVLEARYPVHLHRFCIRRGSGGAGRFRGGDGVIREFEFLSPLKVSILSQRRTTAPYGLEGGANGRPGKNLLRRAGSEVVEELPPIVHFDAGSGDRLTIETPGGGGYGTPPSTR